jgi:hypothetical protein
VAAHGVFRGTAFARPSSAGTAATSVTVTFTEGDEADEFSVVCQSLLRACP